MSTKTCPECEKVCGGGEFCIGENCGKEPCLNCKQEHFLKDQKNTSMQEYYSFLLDGPDDAARVLQLVDDGLENPRAYPHKGSVWHCVDKKHKLYLKMNPQIATELGMELMLAAGMCLAEQVKQKAEEQKAENKHDPQVQDPQPGSGSAEQGGPPSSSGN